MAEQVTFVSAKKSEWILLQYSWPTTVKPLIR